MKRPLTLILALCITVSVSGQKKQLDHDAYDGWQRIASTALTDDGSIMAYQISPQEGDGEIVVRRLINSKRKPLPQEVKIPRGTGIVLSPDASWAYLTIKPEFAKTRQARIDKKKPDQMPKDTFAVLNLKTFEIRKFAGSKSFSTGFDAMPYAAYKYDKGVVVVNPATGAVDTLKHADSFEFNRSGDALAVIYKKNKKDSLSTDKVMLHRLMDGSEPETLSEGLSFYSSLEFDNQGRQLAFLASSDTTKDGNKHCALMLHKDGITETVIPQDYRSDKGWTLNENSRPYFSQSGSRIFAGIAPFLPDKDTSIVDFETAKLDLWSWDALATPPQQKARRKNFMEKTYLSVIDIAARTLIPLTDSFYDRITLVDGGDGEWALSSDSSPYMISSTWDGNSYTDVDFVSLKDGSRENVFTKHNGGVSVSPKGGFLYWYSYDDCNWYTYEIASKSTVNLTGNMPTAFYDEEDDHPMVPYAYDRPSWIEDESGLVIADRYDQFLFSPDGSSVQNLTKGEGRGNKVQFRRADVVLKRTFPGENRIGIGRTLNARETLWMTAFDEVTKKNGYGTLSGLKPQKPKYFTDEYTFTNVKKAPAGEILTFCKGNFRNPYDLYAGKDFTDNQKLTSLNPQQDTYRWGDVQLVHWTAYDGKKLDGLLYVPDGTQPDDKLPLMIYFYEKNAETLYNYIQPAPSRSIICIPFYVSRGYAVFVPDIVYETGHPGESAYNCIVSGAEAMCSQFSFIDRENMAIQGQSWGGYQTAYLITRTDMFKAAGSGAPVGNMTSAYGGIRWESGNVRAVQYEHGQSRIGKSMWEPGGLELYIENSPVFFVDKVNTPVLIMHNDADGAVPWYQGIEFFMNLRRFGKQAWLLQYNDEAHNLRERRNCKDLSIRLQQFFDHYLKGEPMPAWMKTGLPITRKGQYFGFEPAD